MGLRITTNVPAINANRNLANSQRLMHKASAQLSSGYRINQAADDAAGLAISETMKSHIRSAIQARRNANDGISLIQTAEGGLSEISNMLIRMRELGIQASSDTISNNERGLIDAEIQQLKAEIERSAQAAEWNSVPLLNGQTPVFDFQIGINNTNMDVISFDGSQNTATLDALGLDGIDMLSKNGARDSLSRLDSAQDEVHRMRAYLGAIQNRLVATTEILSVTEENLAAANSRIRDTDIAAATADMARNQVLLQAGTAALLQANQNNQLALKLLG